MKNVNIDNASDVQFTAYEKHLDIRSNDVYDLKQSTSAFIAVWSGNDACHNGAPKREMDEDTMLQADMFCDLAAAAADAMSASLDLRVR